MADKKKKVVAEKRAAHGTGVTALARKLILEGKTNQQVLAAVHKKFPTSKLSMGNVGWVRNDLRKKGADVKMNRDLVAA